MDDNTKNENKLSDILYNIKSVIINILWIIALIALFYFTSGWTGSHDYSDYKAEEAEKYMEYMMDDSDDYKHSNSTTNNLPTTKSTSSNKLPKPNN